MFQKPSCVALPSTANPILHNVTLKKNRPLPFFSVLFVISIFYNSPTICAVTYIATVYSSCFSVTITTLQQRKNCICTLAAKIPKWNVYRFITLQDFYAVSIWWTIKIKYVMRKFFFSPADACSSVLYAFRANF